MSTSAPNLQDWTGRTEQSDDIVTATPYAALAATLAVAFVVVRTDFDVADEHLSSRVPDPEVAYRTLLRPRFLPTLDRCRHLLE